MNFDFDQLTFLVLNWDLNNKEQVDIQQQIDSLTASDWMCDRVRGFNHLRMWPKHGLVKEGPNCPMKTGEVKKTSELPWDDVAEKLPSLKKMLHRDFHSWMETLPRLCLCWNAPGQETAVHVDASEKDFARRCHKIRIVFQHEPNSLFFIDSAGMKHYPKTPQGPFAYVIDGSHMHGVEAGKMDRYFATIGFPWRANEPHYEKLLESSVKRYPEYVIWRNEIHRPKPTAHSFNPNPEKMR